MSRVDALGKARNWYGRAHDDDSDACYGNHEMTKARKVQSRDGEVVGPPAASDGLRNTKTGQMVVVKGVGALKASGFTIRKGVNLLKPIAEQALAQRSKKNEGG